MFPREFIMLNPNFIVDHSSNFVLSWAWQLLFQSLGYRRFLRYGYFTARLGCQATNSLFLSATLLADCGDMLILLVILGRLVGSSVPHFAGRISTFWVGGIPNLE